MDYTAIYEKQRAYYRTGATRSREARMEALGKLSAALKENRSALMEALEKDLNKQPEESLMCELGVVSQELRCARKHLKRWMKDKSVHTPLYSFPGRSFISPEPLGQVLIISPWNYPVQLCLVPLIGAIAAGNCVVVKPSCKTPACSAAIKAMLNSVFTDEFVYVAEGSHEQTAGLLDLKWDHIFFTGSRAGAEQVMSSAARYLTPITLELGGKSPVIVDNTADLKKAARRIAFGKTVNAGQTCVAPDYLLIHQDAKEEFLKYYTKALKKFFPRSRFKDLVHIVNDQHFLRLTGYLEQSEILVGGTADPERRLIQPTVIGKVGPNSSVMNEEVFGPVLPLIEWTDINSCIDYINSKEKPLALYLFTKDKLLRKAVLDRCSFGGGCINDTLMHFVNDHAPFGGVGNSGMGAYHGKYSFDTFSHYRSVLHRGNWIDPGMRYMPYTHLKSVIIKLFLR